MSRSLTYHTRDLVINDKIGPTYHDMTLRRSNRWGELRLDVPVAGHVRINLFVLARLLPASITLLAWWLDSDRLPLGDRPRCPATLDLGGASYPCQAQDDHSGHHMYVMGENHRRLPYAIYWPGYRELRDATDSRPPARKRQRKTL